MKFRVKRFTNLLEKANGPKIDNLFPNEIVTDTGKTEGAFMEVDPGDGTLGWVLQADCESVAGAPRPEIDRGTFVHECVIAERVLNELPTTAPWFVAADYVIARALLETELTNAGPKIADSDAAGPLQVSSEEWKAFVTNGGDFATSFRLGDHDHPLKQIRAATYRMYADAKAISALKKDQGVGSDSDPFVPSYLDLFHAYLTNSPEAAVAIRDAEESGKDGKKPIKDILKRTLADAQVTDLFAGRSQYFGAVSEPKSLSKFLTETEAALTGAMSSAFELIKKFAPDELPEIRQGEAPWFDVALEAEKQRIAEATPEHKKIILDYFLATDHGRPNKIVPWCGAFVAHCLKNCGSPAAAASIPKGAARAINWKNWANPLPTRDTDIPVGAVVVLSPSPGTGSSGHVGFFVQLLGGQEKIELLGGNQSDKVKRSKYPVSRVVGVGWLDLEPESAEDQFTAESASGAISDRAFNLIVESEVTSKETYEKRFRHPVWPGAASGVTIGIGYDVGHTSKQRLRSDWKDFISPEMIGALERAVGVKGAAAKHLARQLGASVDIPWDAAIKVHRKSVMPRWIGVVDKALPNTDSLNPNQLGALVSLTYNRGPSFSKQGARYREMRAIKQHMTSKKFGKIPAEIRSMKRLWPNLKGLRIRREREARLFEVV